MDNTAWNGRAYASFCGCWRCGHANTTATEVVYLDEVISMPDPTPKVDRRCKRCLELHPGKPCRSEMKRRSGKRTFTLVDR